MRSYRLSLQPDAFSLFNAIASGICSWSDSGLDGAAADVTSRPRGSETFLLDSPDRAVG